MNNMRIELEEVKNKLGALDKALNDAELIK
jgi:hypothetical protein